MIPNEQDQFRKIRQEHQARHILEILVDETFHGRTNDGILCDILEPLCRGRQSSANPCGYRWFGTFGPGADAEK